MKRTPLTRKTPLKASRHPMKKRGETKRKKEQRYLAYMRSPAWKAKRQEALNRAGHQCEYRHDGHRCPATEGLQVHHVRYSRMGWELPHDLTVYCTTHHELIETTYYPHRHTHRRNGV